MLSITIIIQDIQTQNDKHSLKQLKIIRKNISLITEICFKSDFLNKLKTSQDFRKLQIKF